MPVCALALAFERLDRLTAFLDFATARAVALARAPADAAGCHACCLADSTVVLTATSSAALVVAREPDHAACLVESRHTFC